MKLPPKGTILILATTALTIILAIYWAILLWLPVHLTPDWLWGPHLVISLLTLWFYSCINTFNYVWQSENNTLLELIHGFSLLGILWSLANRFELFSVHQLGDIATNIENFIIIVLLYLTLTRTLLASTQNRISNIFRTVALISMSIFMGLHIVTLFIPFDPDAWILTNAWYTALLLSILTVFLTVLLHFIPSKGRKS